MQEQTDGATIALGVEYDGAAFSGFQRQRDRPSVQATLEAALSRVADEPVQIVAAGRTDAGVHATGQVVSFRTSASRPLVAWQRGVNALAGGAVSVSWARAEEASFHARFSAVARRYAFVFVESEAPPALLRGKVCWSRQRLDATAMHEAAQALLGEQDFTSFRAAGCQSRSPFRCVQAASVRRHENRVVFEIQANAFLLRMVRNIAGALQEVGRQAQPADCLERLLQLKNRSAAPRTAPPGGLYLTQVSYPHFAMPNRAPPVF